MASNSMVSVPMGVDPGETTAGYSETSPHEKPGGLVKNHNGNINPSQPLLLHRLFELQAAKTPTLAALQWESNAPMTYEQLNKASNQLARYLESRFAAHSTIAIYMEKSKLLIVSVLAVLKANMISVPLDIDAPSARLENILKVCDCQTILTVSDSEQTMSELVRIVRVDTLMAGSEIQTLSDDNLDNIGISNEDLICHILFTSGSTGLSKGVQITHRAVVHNALVFAEMFNVDQNTRCLQFAAPTFAVFIIDVFQTLFSGGCLVMATRATIMSDITTFIRDMEITVCWLTPTVSRFIDPTQVPSLKVLLNSGENLPAEVADKWRYHRSCSLWNSLGSTEALAYTAFNLSASSASSSHVGQAIPGMKVIILEPESVSEVLEGQHGEICVSGPQLLHGYLSNNNAQSRDVYVGGIRFFRTGDLGVVEKLACGKTSIRCIGRGDSQVKINGIRLDLGDVEASIIGCPLVRQGIALVPEAGNVSGQLTAIIALDSDSIDSTSPIERYLQASKSITVLESSSPLITQLSQIKEHVHKALPRHAVPRQWWIIESLPLMTSGKIDRLKLRIWLEQLDRSEYLSHIGSWTNPQDPFTLDALEIKLKAMWADILDLPVSILHPDVSFFDFGADSLTVTQLVSKARAAGLSFTYEQVFLHKTIRHLAQSMIAIPSKGAEISTLGPLSNTSQDKWPPPKVTHPQSPAPFSLLGMDDVSAIFSSQNNIEDIVPASELQVQCILASRKLGHPVFVWFILKLGKTCSINRLLKASETVSQRHSVLRTDLQVVGNKCYQVIMKHNIDFKIKGCNDDYDQVCSLIDREMVIPVPFGKHLTRFRLFISDNGTQNLGIGLCHSLFDGFSMPLIYRDLEAAYFGTLENPVAPPYSLYIRHSIQTSQNLGTNKFWSEILRGSQMTRIFKPKLEYSTYGMIHLKRTIPYTWKQHNGMSLATVLKAAFALTLSKLSCLNDITFGSIASGRSASIDGALEIVGPFMNILPARFNIENNMTVSELLQKVLDQHISMIPYESTPLTQISRCAGWESSLFGSTIAVQNVPTQGDFTQWKLAGIASYHFDEHFQEFALLVYPRRDGILNLQLDFKRDLHPPRVELILGLFVDILQTINDNPERKVSTILSGTLSTEPSQEVDIISSDMALNPRRHEYVPPGVGEILTLLKTLWACVLPDAKDPDPDKSFFDLGGDKIMAAHLTILCEKAGFDFNLSDVFDYPTLNMQCLRILGYGVGMKREPVRLKFWPVGS